MAYAMKRRRNAGAPKRRKQLTTMRGSASFERGQRLAGKLIAGRKLRGSQKEIRQQIHKLVRENGSKSDIALLEGPIGVGKAPHEFRKGLASVAADVAGFKPSRSSSRAGKTVSREFARDKRDTKRGFESASAQAMRVRAEQGVSLKEAWAIVKGESKPKRKSKSSGRRKESSSRSRARKNPRKGMSYAGILRILKEQAMVVRQTLPGKFRLKVEGSASPRASLTGRDYASIFGMDPASSFSVTMTPPGEESETYHSNMVGDLSPEAMSEMHPIERAQTARRYLTNNLPDEYRPRKSRRKNPSRDFGAEFLFI